MNGVKKISGCLAIWLAIESLYVLSLVIFPHVKFEMAGFLAYSLQTLLFLICIHIVKREPTRKNKPIFINFAAFFSLSLLAHLFNFIGPSIPAGYFFDDERFARLIIDQYIFRGAYFLLLANAIIYVAVDELFRDFGTARKFALTSLVAMSFFVGYYRPLLSDPLYLHNTGDVKDWRVLDRTFKLYREVHGEDPDPKTLASQADLLGSDQDGFTYSLPLEEKLTRVETLYPYLFDMNWQILVYRPLLLNQIYMSVVCVGFILLFFGYQFLKDPPQGAYIEKVMFLLLVFCTLEILHGWISLTSFHWAAFAHMVSLGQYVSIFVLALIAMFLMLRLNFISSVNGEFYEQELLLRPSGITRWRDRLDNIVIEKFFNPKVIIGRFLVDPTRR